MICPSCSAENREGTKYCKQCGLDFSLPPPWRPTWRWHLKTLAVLYVFLTVVYFAVSGLLSRLPEPHGLREVPKELTPWLK